MAVKYEIKAKTGEDSSGKAFYQKIGVVLQGDKGFSMKLNCIPLNWDGFAFFSEPEQRQGGGRSAQQSQQRPQRPQQRPQEDFPDDDVPF